MILAISTQPFSDLTVSSSLSGLRRNAQANDLPEFQVFMKFFLSLI
jgi:hypothetical protein